MVSPLGKKAMPTLEYFILLGMVVSIILLSLKSTHLPFQRSIAEDYFSFVGQEIMGARVLNADFVPVPRGAQLDGEECLPIIYQREDEAYVSYYPCEQKECVSRVNFSMVCYNLFE